MVYECFCTWTTTGSRAHGEQYRHTLHDASLRLRPAAHELRTNASRCSETVFSHQELTMFHGVRRYSGGQGLIWRRRPNAMACHAVRVHHYKALPWWMMTGNSKYRLNDRRKVVTSRGHPPQFHSAYTGARILRTQSKNE